MSSIYPLKNCIMPYAWGSTTAIAALMGNSTPSDTPQAELWMGAHPKAPSLIKIDDEWLSLIKGIENDPKSMLGPVVARRFKNRLPYLLKVLAVAKPLSIQAHPDKVQAEKGFEREEAQQISIDAPHRNYRDANHKPECICALTPFWALNGFRPIESVRSMLLNACRQTLGSKLEKLFEGSRQFFLKRTMHLLMTLSPEQKNDVLDEALATAQVNSAGDPAWDWVVKLAQHYSNDIGILSPLFLNLVCLSPGQAMFLPAGRMHAYLEGTGLELMANSDNVLRGGLTPKHMDVDELLKVIQFEPTPISPIFPRRLGPCEEKYDTPAVEFSLTKITLDGTKPYQSISDPVARIVLCVDGTVVITDSGTGETVEIKKGGSVFVPGSVVDYALLGKGVCYTATVPF